MVALNQRLSVTHNGHNTWKLHIAHVQLNDSGSYMCQVNTDPMRSQVSFFLEKQLKCRTHTHTHSDIPLFLICELCFIFIFSFPFNMFPKVNKYPE